MFTSINFDSIGIFYLIQWTFLKFYFFLEIRNLLIICNKMAFFDFIFIHCIKILWHFGGHPWYPKTRVSATQSCPGAGIFRLHSSKFEAQIENKFRIKKRRITLTKSSILSNLLFCIWPKSRFLRFSFIEENSIFVEILQMLQIFSC